jgi:hypothetical protein
LIEMMALALPFYVTHATDVLNLSDSVLGSFVAAQALARAMAGFLFGLLSERQGPRYVIWIGSAAAVSGPLFALGVHISSVGWLGAAYPFVFVTLGFVQASYMLGFFNYLMEIAPGDLRPVYVGFQNTVIGLLMLVPIIGGWLLDATSYTVLFGLTTAVAALGFLFAMRLEPCPRVSITETGS